MAKYKDRVWYKAVLWILLVFFGTGFIGNIFFVFTAADWGAYSRDRDKTLAERIEDANQSNSVMALRAYLGRTDDGIAETDTDVFQYGILKSDTADLSGIDLKDSTNYLEYHFTDDSWDETQLSYFHYPVYVTSQFQYSVNVLWNQCYIYTMSNNYSGQIEAIKYRKKTDTYYYKIQDEDWLIPVADVSKDEDGTIVLDGITYNAENIESVTEKEIAEAEAESRLLETTYELAADDSMTLLMDIGKGEGMVGNFWVVSYHPSGSVRSDVWWDGNRYDKLTALNDLFYRYAYVAIAGIGVSFVIALLCFGFLCASAGHHRGREGITAIWLQRIPLELEWGGLFVLEIACAFLVELTVTGINYYNSSSLIAMIVIAGAEIIAAICLVIGALLDFSARIKLGAWWKNTLIFRICRKVYHFLGGIFAGITKNLSLFGKVGAIFAGVSLLEFFVIAGTEHDSQMEIFWWFLEKIILFGLLFVVLIQLKKLQEGSRNIAEGDLTHQIDTSKMLWEFKQHGENLNSISQGMTRAVEERMKSERFKTELITNVSHDIKTPLTSIINYVDLLEKEKLDNPTAEEYLEVLERQSARLKKLIEDLMEASKASTGNLAVHLERLEAGVFLVQTVGEFEEKTAGLELELLIQKPESPVYIMADGRHFWRVIDNLMNNICKYAQPGTRVYINLEVSKEEVLMTFRNTSRYALNVSSEELLERFVRGDSSRNTEGSGLGLSIAQSLMELMNGKMELYVDGDLFKVILHFPHPEGATE